MNGVWAKLKTPMRSHIFKLAVECDVTNASTCAGAGAYVDNQGHRALGPPVSARMYVALGLTMSVCACT